MMLQQQVLNVVRNSGSFGLFASEVADRLDMTEKAVSGTLHTLATSKGKLRREKLFNGHHGRLCWRYWFIEEGQAKLALPPGAAGEPVDAEFREPAPAPADLYTVDQMRDYAEAYHRSRSETPPLAVAANVSPALRTVRISFPYGDDKAVDMTFAEARAFYDLLRVVFGD